MGLARTRLAAFGVALAVMAIGCGGARLAGAQEGAPANGTADETTVESCASDPKVLGLERIVEIDATQGPIFGGGHPREHFLNDKEVVLTFDDGPLRPYTRPVLKALAAHCTKATFFLVGRMAAADPGLVKEIMAAGHTVGSHTWSHQNLKALQYFKARNEVETGLSAVTKAAGRPIAPFFRFPYLSDNRMIQNYVRQRQIATFFIDIDSKDFQTRNSNIVFERVMTQLNAQRKGIILMHDIQPSTAGMIRRLLDTLHQKGFKIVHMVPKQSATTVAGFENGSAKAQQSPDEALTAKPPVIRSLVPTVSSDPEASTARSPAPHPAKPANLSTGSTAAAAVAPATGKEADEVLPWSQGGAPPQVKKPAAPKKQVHRQIEDLPWQMHVFQN